MSDRIPVGIIGASGYGGVQLVRLLLEHPKVEISYLGGKGSAGKSFGEIYPHLKHRINLAIEPIDLTAIAERCEVVFLGLPNGLACDMAPQLLEKGCKVLDLSADYRFKDLETYSAWYRKERKDQSLAAKAVYGLPELYRQEIQKAQLIGCPGCYPTASLLALAPLLKQGLIVPETAIIDAKSGTSGGGREAKTNMLLAEADNSFSAYGVAKHRHTPEIEQIASRFGRTRYSHTIYSSFGPHGSRNSIDCLCDIKRPRTGTRRSCSRFLVLSTAHLLSSKSSAMVAILKLNGQLVPIFAILGLEVDPRTDRVIVLSAIDNLIKGQAGQAVQCLNLMMGWEETLGLPALCFYP